MQRLIVLLFTLFALQPAFGETLEEEIKVGENAHKYIMSHFGAYENENIRNYISEVGQKLLESIEDPEFRYTYTVIEDPMLNAFALPGGYVYVTTGMLAYLDSEAALAGLLGHETGHVIGHHAFKQMKKSMGDTLLIFAGLAGSVATGQGGDSTAAMLIAGSSISSMKRLGYGRELELQADELGMIYAYEAGYDPKESSKMFETLRFKERVSGVGYHGFSATHPDTIERIIKAMEKSQILVNRGKPIQVERERYLNKIRGLSWGKYDRQKQIKPEYRIELYRAQAGDTFRSIADKISEDESLAFEVAVMNSMKPEEIPPVGMLLKIPVHKSKFKENNMDKSGASSAPDKKSGQRRQKPKR